MWKRNVEKVNSWVVDIDDDDDILPLIYEEVDQGIRPKDPNDGSFPGVPRIPFTEDYWTRLWDASLRGKKGLGYDENTLKSDFGKEQRCRNCRFCMWGKRRLNLLAGESKIRENAEYEAQREPDREPTIGSVKSVLYDEMTEECIGTTVWTAELIAQWRRRESSKALQRKTKYGCWGHPGKPVGRYQKLTCCGRNIHSPGCHLFPDHDIVGDRKSWERNWQMHEAPENPVDYRYAIALDCEMGITELGEQELIRISAIDYFSGEILINKLVFPRVKMWHLNVRYSGVEWPQLYAAKAANNVINGRDEARNLLFQYLGPKTILVMQGGRTDAMALRIRHDHILDTLSLAGGSLKSNAEQFLGRKIQQGRGHDSLEDALACRDIAHHFMLTLPFDHIYKRNYGQMTRDDLRLERYTLPTRPDGTTPPEWIPPVSQDRVPFLKNYPRYDCWRVLQIQWAKDDEQKRQEDEEARKEWAGVTRLLGEEEIQREWEETIKILGPSVVYTDDHESSDGKTNSPPAMSWSPDLSWSPNPSWSPAPSWPPARSWSPESSW